MNQLKKLRLLCYLILILLAILLYLASFFYFLIIDLYILNPAVKTQINISVAELVVLIQIPRKDKKADMETYPVIAEIAISEWSI